MKGRQEARVEKVEDRGGHPEQRQPAQGILLGRAAWGVHPGGGRGGRGGQHAGAQTLVGASLRKNKAILQARPQRKAQNAVMKLNTLRQEELRDEYVMEGWAHKATSSARHRVQGQRQRPQSSQVNRSK